MADPTPYERTYSFTDYQASNPAAPLPGLQVDNELENVEQSLSEAIDAIKDVRRSDGALKNGIVTVDSLSPAVLAGVGAGALASAEAAAASADAASDSAVAAAASATAASGFETAASGYASNALTSRNEASGFSDDSAAAAALSQTARDYANKWATEAEDVNVHDGVNPVGQSAYHWAQKAAETAASVGLPPVVADTLLGGNAAGNAWETKTPSEVFDLVVTDGSVANAKLANGSVTLAKLASEVTDAVSPVLTLSFATLTALKADTALTYTAAQLGTVVAGDIIGVRDGGFSYAVAASGASDHHLATAGGVKLYVRPVNGMYLAEAIGLNLDGVTDDSAKVQQLGQWIADNVKHGILVLPSATMYFANRVQIAMPTTDTFANGYRGFAIVGPDPTVSRINMATTNTDGGIRVTRKSRVQNVLIDGIGLYSYISKGTTAADVTNNGIGIYVASDWNPDNPTALGWGTQPHKQVIVRNCFVGSGSGLGFGRWGGGIAVDFAFFAEIYNNSIESNLWNDVYMDPPVFENPPVNGERSYSFGIDVKECYTPSVHNNRIKSRCEYNTRIWSSYQPAFEDWAFYDNIVDGQPMRGLVVECTNASYNAAYALGEPGGRCWGNHFNAHRFDVTYQNIRHVAHYGNFCHLATQTSISTWYKYADERALRLINCQAVTVFGNHWREEGHFTSVNNCSTEIYINAGCTNININGNTHGSTGIAVDCAATAPMSVTFRGGRFGFQQSDGNWNYPTYYFYERSGAVQDVELPTINWTPQLKIGGVAPSGQATVGRLRREGEKVSFRGRVLLTTLDGLTGAVTVDGMPLSPDSRTAISIGFMKNDALGGSPRSVRGHLTATGDVVFINEFSAAGSETAMQHSHITATFEVEFAGEFFLTDLRNLTRLG